ncbi:hypothetical protein NEISICOT_01652 [Neisseria sicca ATCC 29256]|uniref:Uncharacterized protein n=1 Tax=Neisseria sicca ATCC 29256 TaxID=547045 RepID=C6M553_NEISI|nr:hypothetical protein NEISICOT_01652 [Neisseria sicca ATCC 29256]
MAFFHDQSKDWFFRRPLKYQRSSEKPVSSIHEPDKPKAR